MTSDRKMTEDMINNRDREKGRERARERERYRLQLLNVPKKRCYVSLCDAHTVVACIGRRCGGRD